MSAAPSPAPAPAAAATLDGLLAAHAAERPDAPAVVLDGRWGARTLTYGDLARRVADAAAGLLAHGIGPGVRTALLVPPTADFFVLAYALLRVRAVPVVVDPGIGLARVRDCLGEAAPDGFVGVPRAHLARRLLRWCPDARIAVTAGRVAVPGTVGLAELERVGAARPAEPPRRRAGDPAAILFTSGSTGPPKGVEHHEAGLLAQAHLVRDLYDLSPGDVSLATFPPFALFGPALGMTTVVPRMDPTRPGAVVPARIVRAANRHRATVMFGSPALLDRLGRGAAPGTTVPTLRRVVSAGAPVPRETQHRVLALLGEGARVHTPYGATEALPVTSVADDELDRLPDDGICVGRPVPGVDVALMRPVDGPVTVLTPDRVVGPDEVGTVGEVVVRGPVVSPAYADRPTATAAAKIDWDGAVAHRTGDLASRDADGRLWFAGRAGHVVPGPDGPLYSVPCEQVLDHHPAVRRSALVAVAGRPVLVVELLRPRRVLPALRRRLAVALHARGGARPALVHRAAAAGLAGVTGVADLVAELRVLAAADPRTRAVTDVVLHPRLPVDPRHNSKIDREALGRWATRRLRASTWGRAR